ncbi:hypothetical protein [Paracidovorax wautersii]|uniref:hypothetical protein n=1 Tax=Paracidovorax wautersii TaxID=1177982 RepID=UPI0031E0A288
MDNPEQALYGHRKSLIFQGIACIAQNSGTPAARRGNHAMAGNRYKSHSVRL